MGNCKTCLFWEKNRLMCRRHAPTVYTEPRQLDSSINVITVWPTVFESDCCGDWENEKNQSGRIAKADEILERPKYSKLCEKIWEKMYPSYVFGTRDNYKDRLNKALDGIAECEGVSKTCPLSSKRVFE